MPFSKTLRRLTFLLGIWCFLWAPAWAAPTISKISVHTEHELITLNAELIDAFTEKILEAIESGVTITFTYQIELLKKTSVFGDEVVSQIQVTQTVHFNTLKKVYEFTSQGKNINRKVSTKSDERYQQLMLTLKDVPIAHVFKLDPEEKYYARVPPYVTRTDYGSTMVERMRTALLNAFEDPVITSARQALLLKKIKWVDIATYHKMSDIEEYAANLGYPVLQ